MRFRKKKEQAAPILVPGYGTTMRPGWDCIRLLGLRERLWDFGIRWALFARHLGGYRTVRLDRHRVFKWIDTPTEALSMTFVAKNTTIPVPRVYDLVIHEGKLGLIMEFIDARETEWAYLSKAQKADVARQLGGFIAQLRTLMPPHPGIVECIDGAPCRDPKLNVGLEVGTVENFHNILGHNMVREEDVPLYIPLRPAFERIHGRKHRTMFTHADFNWHNILIRDGQIVALLDWESAGWYPEYWEYTRLNVCWLLDREFWQMLQPHLTIYEDELNADIALSRAIHSYT